MERLRRLLEAYDFRGWISPDGERVDIHPGYDHGESAGELLADRFPGWKWWEKYGTEGAGASDALQARGWVRVVSVQGGLTCSCSILNGLTAVILCDLVREAGLHNPVHVDLPGRQFHRGNTGSDLLEHLENKGLI